MRAQFERESPTHIDMSMGDRRNLSQELVRKLLWRLPREGLHLVGYSRPSRHWPAATAHLKSRPVARSCDRARQRSNFGAKLFTRDYRKAYWSRNIHRPPITNHLKQST